MDSKGAAQTDGDRLLRQLFDIFINPEIERREEAGVLKGPFTLQSAQIIMNVGQHRIIRLNDEVRAMMQVRRAPGGSSEGGADVYWDEIESIEHFQLTEEDPNAGHATIIRGADGWFVFFDFRYNGQRVAEVLAAADEFLAMATFAKERGYQRAFMESLFATAELTAKAKLLMYPDDAIITTKSHSHIRSRINLESHLGNTDRDFVALLNRLEQERGRARYVGGSLDLEEASMRAMLTTIESTLQHVKAIAPKRINVAAMQ